MKHEETFLSTLTEEQRAVDITLESMMSAQKELIVRV